VIPAADRAILEMSTKPLVELLTREVTRGVQWHFDAVMRARIFLARRSRLGAATCERTSDFIQYLEQLDDALLIPDEYSFLVDPTSPD